MLFPARPLNARAELISRVNEILFSAFIRFQLKKGAFRFSIPFFTSVFSATIFLVSFRRLFWLLPWFIFRPTLIIGQRQTVECKNQTNQQRERDLLKCLLHIFTPFLHLFCLKFGKGITALFFPPSLLAAARMRRRRS